MLLNIVKMWILGHDVRGVPVQCAKHESNIVWVHWIMVKVEKLDIPASATASLAGYMINANSIGKASFTGMYGVPKK